MRISRRPIEAGIIAGVVALAYAGALTRLIFG